MATFRTAFIHELQVIREGFGTGDDPEVAYAGCTGEEAQEDDGAEPFVAQGFVIEGSGGERTGDGIEQHELQEADGGGNLRRIEPVEQLMRVLFVSRYVFLHGIILARKHPSLGEE